MSRSPVGQQPSRLAKSWQLGLILGVGTLILGIIVALNPTGSLNLIAVLLGVLMLVSGVYYLIRMFDADEPHRVWLGITGLLFVVVGVVLIRHLNLTKAVIALLIAIVWIVQGVVALIAGAAGGSRQGRGWWIVFGVISIIAGIVVTVAPLTSLTTLAVLFGVWFVVMGLFEIVGALLLRHSLHAAAHRLLREHGRYGHGCYGGVAVTEHGPVGHARPVRSGP